MIKLNCGFVIAFVTNRRHLASDYLCEERARIPSMVLYSRHLALWANKRGRFLLSNHSGLFFSPWQLACKIWHEITMNVRSNGGSRSGSMLRSLCYSLSTIVFYSPLLSIAHEHKDHNGHSNLITDN